MTTIIIAVLVALGILFFLKRKAQKSRANTIRDIVNTSKPVIEITASPKHKLFADANNQGKELEKTGDIENAIKVYELAVSLNTDTPYTYQRLAILYKRFGKIEEEIRICTAAEENIPTENSMRQWFSERKLKIKTKA